MEHEPQLHRLPLPQVPELEINMTFEVDRMEVLDDKERGKVALLVSKGTNEILIWIPSATVAPLMKALRATKP